MMTFLYTHSKEMSGYFWYFPLGYRSFWRLQQKPYSGRYTRSWINPILSYVTCSANFFPAHDMCINPSCIIFFKINSRHFAHVPYGFLKIPMRIWNHVSPRSYAHNQLHHDHSLIVRADSFPQLPYPLRQSSSYTILVNLLIN